MSWGSASEFFAMGGYGFYVWGSFIVTAICLAVEPALLALRRKNALEKIRLEKATNETAA